MMEQNEPLTLEGILERDRMIDLCISRDLWGSARVRRLIYALYGTEEEHSAWLEKAPQGEVHAVLRANGIDPDTLAAKLDERLRISGVRRQASEL